MDYEKLAREFMETMHQMRRQKTQQQINDSMHGEQFVLFYISKHEGNVIPSEISNEMEISSARVAAALNSLEGKGLITRKIDIDDRRRILVNLTDLGKAKVEKHYESVMTFTANMLKYLGDHDAEEIVRIMKKLAKVKPDEFE